MDRVALAKQLVIDEGFRPKAYRDTVGKLTIGIGRNLDDNGITREEAEFLCNNDIMVVEQELDRKVPWWRRMSEERQQVLANMCFNMGWPVLSGFKNTLAAMERGDYDAAANGMLASKWAGQVGKRAVRLANRMRAG